jgi:hypothetical protein
MAIRFLGTDTRSAPTYYTLLFSFRADVQVISDIGTSIYVKFNLTGFRTDVQVISDIGTSIYVKFNLTGY